MAPSTAGEPHILATYPTPEGERQLIGQRVNGTVHISDVPAGEQGRVYLVEPELRSKQELDGIVRAYTDHATQLGRCPMQGWV